jgi:hypothetical protein
MGGQEPDANTQSDLSMNTGPFDFQRLAVCDLLPINVLFLYNEICLYRTRSLLWKSVYMC